MTHDGLPVAMEGGDLPADLVGVRVELEQALAPGIQVLSLLGRGGMGAVFLGRDPVLKRQVVVKVLDPALAHDATARRRFAREAESAAAVSHPNVVNIFLVGELPRSGTSYFVMQFVTGPTLAEACPLGTKIPQARCRRFIGEIASALAAAHARGLIHRDIKPSNVMLEGATERAVVLDFGISAALTPRQSSGGERLTVEGTSVGTPEYLSPEQGAGEAVTDRADVYSLGVVAFELLAGRAPFEAATPLGLIAAHMKDTPANIASLRPDLDADFAGLVNRMLAKVPEARPSAAEVTRACAQSVQLLEWPPPGLERLRGAGVVALRLCGAYGAGLATFFAVLAMGDDPRNVVGRLVALTVLAFVDVFLIMAICLSLGVAFNLAKWARRSGYPFQVAADVALDRYPDTDALLNGAGRFASLTPATGRHWLARRRAAAIVVLGGVAASSVMALLWSTGVFHLGTPDPGSSMRLAEYTMVFAPTLAGWISSVVLRAPERSARMSRAATEVALHRLQIAPIPEELVAGWLKSATVAAAASLGAFRRIASAVPEYLFGATMLCGIGAVLTTFVFVVLANIEGPRAMDAVRWRQSVREGLAATGGLAAWDSSISRSALPRGATPDPSAALALADATESNAFDAELSWRAFRAMPARLSDSVRRALEIAAGDPALAPFRRVAAAAPPPAVWYAPAGAIVSANLERMGRRLDMVGRLAMRNIAAAALALDRGDKATAILRAREVISVGRVLARDPLPAAARIGNGLLRTGARALGEIAMITGNAPMARESIALRETVDGQVPFRGLFSIFTLAAAAASPLDSTFAKMAGDTRLFPAERWALAAATARGACANQAELRSGVSPLRFGTLALAESRLGDIARSGEWIQRQREALLAVERRQSGPLEPAPAFWFSTAFSRVVSCQISF